MYMKTNKNYVTLWVIASVLLIWYMSVDAMNNYWYFKYFWYGRTRTSQVQHTGVNHQTWMNHQSGSGKNMPEDPSHMITNIEKSELSKEEEKSLYYQYSEEKVAFDLYTHFYELYNEPTFLNISTSEAKHMEAVKMLLDRYALATPTDFWVLSATYGTLKLEWEKSLQSALEVGLKVEMLDVEDITKTISMTDNDDLKAVFLNIGWASYNHLRWFSKWLENNNLTSTVDFSKYFSQEDVNTKGSLKNKLLERLEKDGVVVSQVVKTNIENCTQNNEKNHGESWLWNGQGKWQWTWQWTWKGMWKNGQWRWMHNFQE